MQAAPVGVTLDYVELSLRPTSGARIDREPLPIMFGRALLLAALVATVALHVWYTWANGLFFDDFRVTIWNGGRAILEGTSPYPPAETRAFVHGAFVYPPLILVVFGALGLLPFWAASLVWGVLLVVAVAGSLVLLGVRDPRCFVVVFLSLPVWAGITWGQATLIILFLVAAAWRYRDHRYLPGLAIGAAIAFKLFVWPLGLWLLATRRFHSAAAALSVITAGNLAAWAMIGFGGLGEYQQLLHTLVEALGAHGALTFALAAKLGADTSLAGAIALLSGFPFLVLGVVYARLRGSDPRAYSAFIVAGLLAAQIAWMHYLALLFVVAALRSPRLGVRWILPSATAIHFVAFTTSPFTITLTTGAPRATWVLVVCLLIVVAAATALRPGDRPTTRRSFDLTPQPGESAARA